MDIYSKVFLINIVCFLFCGWIDGIFNDKLSAVVGLKILNLWTLISLVSVPIYVIYLIVEF